MAGFVVITIAYLVGVTVLLLFIVIFVQKLSLLYSEAIPGRFIPSVLLHIWASISFLYYHPVLSASSAIFVVVHYLPFHTSAFEPHSVYYFAVHTVDEPYVYT